jgi:hypothetical protein
MAKKKTTAEQTTTTTTTTSTPSAPTRRRATRSKAAAPAAGTVPVPATAADFGSHSSGNGDAPTSRREPTQAEIAEAAYHRFLRRGGVSGDEFNDWVEAERELREQRSR